MTWVGISSKAWSDTSKKKRAKNKTANEITHHQHVMEEIIEWGCE